MRMAAGSFLTVINVYQTLGSCLSLVLILGSSFLVDPVENESVSKAKVWVFNLALHQHVWEGAPEKDVCLVVSNCNSDSSWYSLYRMLDGLQSW